MSFENLVFILQNYIKHEYKNVIVTDLTDARVQEIQQYFKSDDYIIISLSIETDEELKRRVLSDRDSGFKNVEKALAWNRNLKKRQPVPNEHKVDNTHTNPNRTVDEILRLVA